MSHVSRCLSGGTGVLLMLSLFAGCQSSDPPVSPGSHAAPVASEDGFGFESRVLLEPAATEPALTLALSQTDVASARDLLETEGYAYVASNSLVLIRRVGAPEPPTFEASAQGLSPRNWHDRIGRGRVDTVTWLAFESPSHDLANHTAVLHFSNGSRSGTVLVELDISSDTPQVIRQGYMDDGHFHSGDVGTEAWLACMAGGLSGSIVRCSMTNCGFGHCMGAGAAISLAGCTAVSLWNWMSS